MVEAAVALLGAASVRAAQVRQEAPVRQAARAGGEGAGQAEEALAVRAVLVDKINMGINKYLAFVENCVLQEKSNAKSRISSVISYK